MNKMKSTTLVIMAAGMGSRFGGGIKQLEAMGPNGEIIMDYSIYDAIEAGFNKVVFVTRKDLLATFKEVIGDRIAKVIPVEYAFQELSDVPEGFSVPEGRTKPWVTMPFNFPSASSLASFLCVVEGSAFGKSILFL
jgi:dTDP-glucose pyrophosphorylase